MKSVNILLPILLAANFGPGLTGSISRRVFSFLSNCTSGAGNTRLLFYSPSVSGSEVSWETPGSVPVNSSLSTVFLIHGFLSHGSNHWVNDMAAALLEAQPRNVFVVDWRVGACSEAVKYLNIQSYSAAAANTKDVGRYVARRIESLVDDYSILLQDVWIIGHSLGAHVASFAGKSLYARSGQRLGRITGLDPAGPLFRGLDSSKRLDKTDAVFVEVLHTCRLLGLQEAVGHVDLYYNGGKFQMSCLLRKPGCSHKRAVSYYIEAIKNPNCRFVAKPWSRDRGDRRTSTTCTDSCTTIAGPLAPKFSARGTFYVQTNTDRPYCTGESPALENLAAIPADDNPLDENIFDIAI